MMNHLLLIVGFVGSMWSSPALADDLGCYVSGGTVPGAFTQFTGTATSVTAGVTDPDDAIASPYATPTMTDRGSNVWTAANVTAGATVGLHKIRMTGTVNGATETGIDTFVVATVCPTSTLVATDNIGINWGDITNPTTVQNLSGTNIDVDQVVASVSGAVGSVTASVNLPAIPADWITAAGVADALEKRLGFWGVVTVAGSPAATTTSFASTSFSVASDKAYVGLIVNCGEAWRRIERFDAVNDQAFFPLGDPFPSAPSGTCDVYTGVRK